MLKDFFAFEQLNGDYPELRENIRCGMPTAVFGISQPHKYLIASMIDAPIVYITADAVASRKAAENIATLSGKKVELLSAKDEVLLYRKALSKDAYFRRVLHQRQQISVRRTRFQRRSQLIRNRGCSIVRRNIGKAL